MGSVSISVLYGFKYPISQGNKTKIECSPLVKIRQKLGHLHLKDISEPDIGIEIKVNCEV